jgi:hypothetical protein
MSLQCLSLDGLKAACKDSRYAKSIAAHQRTITMIVMSYVYISIWCSVIASQNRDAHYIMYGVLSAVLSVGVCVILLVKCITVVVTKYGSHPDCTVVLDSSLRLLITSLAWSAGELLSAVIGPNLGQLARDIGVVLNAYCYAHFPDVSNLTKDQIKTLSMGDTPEMKVVFKIAFIIALLVWIVVPFALWMTTSVSYLWTLLCVTHAITSSCSYITTTRYRHIPVIAFVHAAGATCCCIGVVMTILSAKFQSFVLPAWVLHNHALVLLFYPALWTLSTILTKDTQTATTKHDEQTTLYGMV